MNGLRSMLDAAAKADALDDFRAQCDQIDRHALLRQLNAVPHTSSERPDLVGRPCRLSAAEWHVSQLFNNGTVDLPSDECLLAKLKYHARWLIVLLDPADNAFDLTVSIVIPVYNRASVISETILSCVEQQHPSIEIVIVDDGSTDNLIEMLDPWIQDIVLVRQENGGVSSARNAGIVKASGDFIHFLDSDDLLKPAAISAKIDAFRTIPDAGVCFSMVDGFDPHSLSPSYTILPEPDGSEGCATTAILNSPTPGFLSATMLPLWVARSTAPFDEALRRSNDQRYWFSLGARQLKAIALRRGLTVRRRLSDGLSLPDATEDLFDHVVALMAVVDALENRQIWHHICPLVLRLAANRRLSRILSADEPLIHKSIQRLMSWIDGDSESGLDASVSNMPALLCLLAGLAELDREGHVPAAVDSDTPFSYLRSELLKAIEAARPMSGNDIADWIRRPAPAADVASCLAALQADLAAGLPRASVLACLEMLFSWSTSGKEELASADGRNPLRTSVVNVWKRLTKRVPGKRGEDSKIEAWLSLYSEMQTVSGWEAVKTIGASPHWAEFCAYAIQQTDHLNQQEAPLRSLLERSIPVQWHIDQLNDLLSRDDFPPLMTANRMLKIRFHARWLNAALQFGGHEPPKVAIIVDAGSDTSNLADTLLECTAQSYPNIDITVLTDQPLAGFNQLIDSFNIKVDWHRRVRSCGVSAFNFGLTSCNADYATFVIGGDGLAPTFIEEHLACHAARPEMAAALAMPMSAFAKNSKQKSEGRVVTHIGPEVMLAAVGEGTIIPAQHAFVPCHVLGELRRLDDSLMNAAMTRWCFRAALMGFDFGLTNPESVRHRSTIDISPDEQFAGVLLNLGDAATAVDQGVNCFRFARQIASTHLDADTLRSNRVFEHAERYALRRLSNSRNQQGHAATVLVCAALQKNIEQGPTNPFRTSFLNAIYRELSRNCSEWALEEPTRPSKLCDVDRIAILHALEDLQSRLIDNSRLERVRRFAKNISYEWSAI